MIYRFGEVELDTERYELRHEGETRHLEPQVFDVLAYLIAHRDRVVTREELLAQVWGHSFVSEATLSSRLMAARKAIGDSGRAQELIRTARGRGYQFIGTVEETDGAGSMPIPIEPDFDGHQAIGRAGELAELSRLLGAATRGERQFALVTGEPGAGKTTLIGEFVELARSQTPLIVMRGRCLEQRGAAEPYLAVLEALTRLWQGRDGEYARPILTRLAPTWLSQLPGLLEGEELESARQRSLGMRPERMVREMGQALEALGASVPVVLLLDDLHWGDQSTLDLLRYVARGDDPARLLIVGAARPDAGGAVDELRRELRPRRRCVELALASLTEEEVGTYLEQRHPGIESLARLIHARTDGNPLFVDCLLGSWIDADVLSSEQGVWRLRGDAGELAKGVPDTLRELLEHDLERLETGDQELLSVASVVGSEFSAAAVAAGLELDLEAVEGRGARLARRGRFLRELDAERWPDGTVAAAFEFVHDLHRQVLYERIPPARRARLHGEIAARLASGYGRRSTELAAELAVHYLEARQPDSAIRYLQLAAEQALARGSHHDAFDDLITALGLLERTPDLPDRESRELSLHSALASALIATEGWASMSAERAYQRALELARGLGDDQSAAVILYGLASLHEYRGEYRRSESLLDEALRMEGAEREAARLLEAHELMACSLFHQGSFEAAVGQADRGLALSQPDQSHPALAFQGEDPAVSCNDWAGLSLWCLGYSEEARERIQTALELASAPGREYGLANARMHAARLHQLRREPGEALPQAEDTLRLAGERGFAYQAAVGLILEGWSRACLGRRDEGVERIRDGLDAHRASGAAMDRPYFLALLAEATLDAGDPEGATAAIAEALELVGDDRSFFYEAELHRLRGKLWREADRAEDAALEFRKALEVAREQQARSLELRAALSLAELLREQPAVPDALSELSAVCDWFDPAAESSDLRAARELTAVLRAEEASRS
jgi:DNA-binding winged helix-turn-helix (wHTH) protein/predicted ATPase/type II secretory pathway predicted ATPase ExeA